MSYNQKLRILCIHGYHQNKDSFRQKTGSFRKPLKKYADFDFLEAPHLLKESTLQEESHDPAYLENISASSGPDGRGWWLKNAPDGECGLQESLELLENTLIKDGPFDGLMGFSQGAAFVALACILLGEKSSLKTIKFVILVAGFKSKMPAHAKFYNLEAKVNIPSLHVIGKSDEVISPDRSQVLLELFVNGQLVSHPGGHYVPATKDLRDVYKLFIEQFMTK